MDRNAKEAGRVAGEVTPGSPRSKTRTGTLLGAGAVAGLLAVYSGCYYEARASHRLVLHCSLCDGDEVRPGAGAAPMWSVIFAPAISAENAYREVRDRW